MAIGITLGTFHFLVFYIALTWLSQKGFRALTLRFLPLLSLCPFLLLAEEPGNVLALGEYRGLLA